MNLKKRLTGVENKIARIREELRAAEHERTEISAKIQAESKIPYGYVGKVFVFRDNSYSMPEKPEDFWSVYYKVFAFDRERLEFVVLKFETDSNKDIQVSLIRAPVKPDGTPQLSVRGTVATEEFNTALRNCTNAIVSAVDSETLCILQEEVWDAVSKSKSI